MPTQFDHLSKSVLFQFNAGVSISDIASKTKIDESIINFIVSNSQIIKDRKWNEHEKIEIVEFAKRFGVAGAITTYGCTPLDITQWTNQIKEGVLYEHGASPTAMLTDLIIGKSMEATATDHKIGVSVLVSLLNDVRGIRKDNQRSRLPSFVKAAVANAMKKQPNISNTDICKLLNLNAKTVSGIRVTAGIHRPRQLPTNTEIYDAIKLRADGLSIKAIADKLNRPETTIYRWTTGVGGTKTKQVVESIDGGKLQATIDKLLRNQEILVNAIKQMSM
jgi:transposase-like protein